MSLTGFTSPINLTHADIDYSVAKGILGVYVLGHMDGNNFVAQYVGKSDSELNQTLHEWVGKYEVFRASYCQTIMDGFLKECVLYHQYMLNSFLDDRNHPSRPKGYTRRCPVNGCEN